MILWMMTL